MPFSPCADCGDLMFWLAARPVSACVKCLKKRKLAKAHSRNKQPWPRSMTCSWCEEAFTAWRSSARYCSSRCRVYACRFRKPQVAKDPRPVKQAKPAPPCGTRAGYDWHRANGDECEECRQAETARRSKYGYRKNGTCTQCGKAVHQGKSNRTGIVCHACRHIRNMPVGTVVTCALPGCGNEFATQLSGHSPTGRTVYCSRSCATSASNARRATERRASPEWIGQDRSLVILNRRRARIRARRLRIAETWDGVTDEWIMDRDGWSCRMVVCFKESRHIDREAAWPDPGSRSIDHVIPLSLGGSDTAANKRAAHLRCNIARGNRAERGSITALCDAR